MSIEAFQQAVREAMSELPERAAVQLQKRIALDALRRIVLRTPVDTGHARANWQLEIGSRPDGERTGGGDPRAEAEAKLRGLRPYEVVYITNNAPYIVELERGHSNRAPQGMVAVTVEELLEMFR